eukprot:3151013-Amphidinium_carterae.1
MGTKPGQQHREAGTQIIDCSGRVQWEAQSSKRQTATATTADMWVAAVTPNTIANRSKSLKLPILNGENVLNVYACERSVCTHVSKPRKIQLQ